MTTPTQSFTQLLAANCRQMMTPGAAAVTAVAMITTGFAGLADGWRQNSLYDQKLMAAPLVGEVKAKAAMREAESALNRLDVILPGGSCGQEQSLPRCGDFPFKNNITRGCLAQSVVHSTTTTGSNSFSSYTEVDKAKFGSCLSAAVAVGARPILPPAKGAAVSGAVGAFFLTCGLLAASANTAMAYRRQRKAEAASPR